MRKKISEVFNVWTEEYFWSRIFELTGYEELMPSDMALKYATRSGEKLISPLLEHVTDINQIGDIIYQHYKTNWEHLHAILTLTYDPIANYDRTERWTDTTQHSGTVKDAGEVSKGTTVTRTPELTTTEKGDTTYTPTTSEEVKHSGQDEDTRQQASFSSSLGDVYKDIHKKGSTVTTTHKGNDKTVLSNTSSQSGTDTTTYGGSDTETTTRTYDNQDAVTHEGSISGNIGVTTTQQMAQSEIELWSSFNFCDKIMEDVDKLITLRIY